MSFLVVGSVAYDGIETPFGSEDKILGGSATYISITAGFFGLKPRLVGVVGRDFAVTDVQLLKSHGVDLEGLQVDNSGDTFFWRGKYHFDLNNRDTLETRLNVFEHFNPEIPDSYKDSEYICLGNIAPSLQNRVLDQVNKPKLVVCDTMNFWIDGARQDLKETLKRVDVLIINDSEARELSLEPNLIRAAEKIHKMGPEVLIIKKGEHGALLFTGSGIFSAPAYPLVDIFDPTGAGDTFMGGFVGWLAKTGDLRDENMRRAVIFGSVMASFCVEAFGSKRLVTLENDDIEKRYAEFMELSTIPELISF